MAIDPTAMVGAAMKALDGYKQALENAAEVAVKAKRILKVIDLFEVTLLMIPSRGDQSTVKKMIAKEGGEASEEDDKGGPSKSSGRDAQNSKLVIKDMIKAGGNYVVEEYGEQAWKKIKENILDSPAGGAFGILSFMYSASKEEAGPVMSPNRIKPGQVMKDMKEQRCTDLEITFVGMAFVINGALEIIEDAIKTLAQVETAQCLWVIQPWKVKKQNLLGDELNEHVGKIAEYNAQLQNAVSIASYAVSLEQLENALNATTMLDSYVMRNFWKRRIGIDKMRVPMSLVTESFLAEVKGLLSQSKTDRGHVGEVVKRQCDAEVVFSRLLANLWNDNADEWASVYEVNNSTGRYGKTGDAVGGEFRRLLALETDFYSRIVFTPLEVFRSFDFETIEDEEGNPTDLVLEASWWETLRPARRILELKAGKDGKTDTGDDVRILNLKPFERLVMSCVVPVFDLEVYEFDCLCLVRFDKDPTLSKRRAAVLTLEEVPHTRTYLSVDTNEELHGADPYNWNAPQSWPLPAEDESSLLQYPAGRLHGLKDTDVNNFRGRDIKIEANADGAIDDSLGVSLSSEMGAVTLDKVNVAKTMHVLYTPLLTTPGHYSVRYCLDSLEKDANDVSGSSAFKKKQAISAKSYYFNRSVPENLRREQEVQLAATPKGVGPLAFITFHNVMSRLLALQSHDAIRSGDLSLIKTIYSTSAKLNETYQALLEDEEVQTLIAKDQARLQDDDKSTSGKTDMSSSASSSYANSPLSGGRGVSRVANPMNNVSKTPLMPNINLELTALTNKDKNGKPKFNEALVARCFKVIHRIMERIKTITDFAQANTHRDFLNTVKSVLNLKDRLRVDSKEAPMHFADRHFLLTHVRPDLASVADFEAVLTDAELETIQSLLIRLELSYHFPAVIRDIWNTLPEKIHEWRNIWGHSPAAKPQKMASKSAEDAPVGEDKTQSAAASTSLSLAANYADKSYDKVAAVLLDRIVLTLRELSAVKAIYRSLLPSVPLDPALVASTNAAIASATKQNDKAKETGSGVVVPVPSALNELSLEQSTGCLEKQHMAYLVDRTKDAVNVAYNKETLSRFEDESEIVHLSANEYFNVKANLLAEDFDLCVKSEDISRLRVVHEQREKLEEANRKYETGKLKGDEGKEGEKGGKNKKKRGSVGPGEVLTAGVLAKQVESPVVVYIPFDKRQLAQSLESMHESLGTSIQGILQCTAITANPAECASLMLSVENLMRVRGEVECAIEKKNKSDMYVENYTQRASPVTESVRDSNDVLQTMGYIIRVEDVPALAWGERYKTHHQHQHAGDHNSGQHNKSQDRLLWRPIVSFDFPYKPLMTYELKPTALEEVDAETHTHKANHGLMAVFVNFPRKKASKAGADTSETSFMDVGVFDDSTLVKCFQESESQHTTDGLTYFVVDFGLLRAEHGGATSFTVKFFGKDSKNTPKLQFVVTPDADIHKDNQLEDGAEGEEAAAKGEAETGDQSGEEDEDNYDYDDDESSDCTSSSSEASSWDGDEEVQDEEQRVKEMVADTARAVAVFDALPVSISCRYTTSADETVDMVIVKANPPYRGQNFTCSVCCEAGRGPAYHCAGVDGVPFCAHPRCMPGLDLEEGGEGYAEYLQKTMRGVGDKEEEEKEEGDN